MTNRFRIIVGTVAALTFAGVCTVPNAITFAGKGGGSNGKKPSTTQVVALDETVPEETDPPTTTVPFEPGTDITGDLTLLDSDLRWGGYAAFSYTYDGTLSNRGMVYHTTVCTGWTEDGRNTVIYQASNVGDFVDGVMDLHELDGLVSVGLTIDETKPGTCQTDLIYRILNDKQHSYQTLDTINFSVAAS